MTYVRLHLEYAVAAWNPNTKEGKRILEKVQKRTTRDTKSLEGLSYEERLLNLGLTSLGRRLERGDMIQLNKILKGSDQDTWFAPPTLRESRKMNRPQYCSKLKSNMAQRANFFTNRMANHWNKLSDESIGANSINTFKNRLDIDLNGYYSSPELCVSC